MPFIRANGELGGGGSEFTQATAVTSRNITGAWDFDADCLLITHDVGSVKQVILADLHSQNFYYSNTNNNTKWTPANWTSAGWSATLTQRSFNITTNSDITNACFVPIKGKPTGYFS